MHELLGWLFSGRQWSLPVLGLRQGFLHGQHWRCELRRVCRRQVLRRHRRHLMHELRSGHLSVQDRAVCVFELRCRMVLGPHGLHELFHVLRGLLSGKQRVNGLHHLSRGHALSHFGRDKLSELRDLRGGNLSGGHRRNGVCKLRRGKGLGWLGLDVLVELC